MEPSPTVEMGFMNESTRGGCTVRGPDCHLFISCPRDEYQSDRTRAKTLNSSYMSFVMHQVKSIVCT